MDINLGSPEAPGELRRWGCWDGCSSVGRKVRVAVVFAPRYGLGMWDWPDK
ncbi:MAG: hypothetical protein Q4D79_07360 [Propionibacteriaceae bacterium]|nr:hypothetical protein [Propionibacteriaceae bacterium]